MYQKARQWIYGLFEVGAGGRLGWYVDTFIILLITGNVIAVVLETVEPLYVAYGVEFYLFEIVSVTIFSIEYCGRIWAATEHEEYQHFIWGRLRFALSPFMLIDLLAIVPFFLGLFIDLRALRSVRFIRFIRLFKLVRYSKSLRLFAIVVRRKQEDLIITSIVASVLLILASTVMYFIERDAQPEAFSSIPAALWWGVITLTTVGYGDVHPETAFGKVVGAIVALLGIGLFALPASILASGYIEVMAEGREYLCPYCGEHVTEDELTELD